jgi:hypothetical protein
MANARPWPLTAIEQPLLNVNAATPAEMEVNWGILNNMLMNFNNLQKQTAPQGGKAPQPTPGKPGGGSSTNVLPYDGVHDNVPYVITNGVLKHFPGPMVIAPESDSVTAVVIQDSSASTQVCTFDTTNGIVYPNRLVLPTFM